MSALARLVKHSEEEFLEAACQDELQRAMELIKQLQEEVQGLRKQLAETEQIATQKELLLCSVSSQEQVLRSELLRNRFCLSG